MNHLHSIFFALILLLCCSCSQKPLINQQRPSHPLDSLFTWEVETSDKGTQMFLKAPYQPCDTCKTEFLTLSVTKNKSEERPSLISVMLSCYEDEPDRMLARPEFVTFLFLEKTQTDSLEWKTDPLENDLPGFYVGKCEHGTYTCRMADGYTKELYGERTVDVFRKFQKFDEVDFLINCSDGSEKVVKVPLQAFQKQYEALK